MEPPEILRVREGLVARLFEDEAVVLDIRTSTYLAANPAATVIWRALGAGATRAQLVAAVLAEFEVTPDRAAADVDEFIDDCGRRGYLESSPVGSETTEVKES